MTDAYKDILDSLRAELADLPEESVRRTVEYYEEYFADAAEAGRSAAETLARLGGVKEIAAHARAEAALSGAELRPGPFRLIGVGRQVLRGLAGTAGRASLVLGAAVPCALALGFYLFALAAFLGAPAGAALVGGGLAGMPNADALSRVSLVGAGLFCAALMIAAGLGLWTAAGAVTRVTLGVLRRGLQKKSGAERRPKSPPARKSKIWIAFLVFGLAALLGAAGLFLSDLPLRLFSIWNSMKPADLVVREWSFAPDKVREIEVRTMNSAIVLETAALPGNSIRIAYEEPAWLTGTPALGSGKLAFREVSSGTLPFMDFIARHPGTTAVRIALPRGYRPQAVRLASGSGNVSFSASAISVRAETGSGDIFFDAAGNSYRIRAATRGRITAKGKAREGGSYEAGNGAPAELITGDGTIEIR